MAYFRGRAVSSREGVPLFFPGVEVESMFLLPAKNSCKLKARRVSQDLRKNTESKQLVVSKVDTTFFWGVKMHGNKISKICVTWWIWILFTLIFMGVENEVSAESQAT